MHRFHVIVLAAAISLSAGSAFAADLKLMPRVTPKARPIQTDQPNCSRWTDECVNCTRDADGAAPVCSNIGFACQPKAIRCLGSDVPPDEPRK